NAVAQQTARTVRLFKHGDRMASTGKLLSSRKTRRAGTDDGNRLSGALGSGVRLDPAFLPPTVHNRAFNAFDRDRFVGDVQRASRFTRCRAHATGEFREVVG